MPAIGAVTGAIGAVVGYKSYKNSKRATAQSVEQQRELSAEERRRKQYQFKRETADILAGAAASGINGIRKTEVPFVAKTSSTPEYRYNVLLRRDISELGGPPSESPLSTTEYSGIFGEYLQERSRVHEREMEWMRKTGLSGIESTKLEGRAAGYSALTNMISSAGQASESIYDWWKKR